MDTQNQLGILNLRINDMMEQLNKVVKAFMDEIAELKAAQAKAGEGELPVKE